ncbi:hypothetical protein [Patulibacter americanus]|uniref:hypothetical protein n=1 Tax=Patulibacter americanus TaxID=588672 RepID=UPI0003B4BF71|nr:hypothetical protein [Patulibacter americanus]
MTALAAVAVASPAVAAKPAAVPAGGVLRAVTESRGSGPRQQAVTRLDIIAPDGTRRWLATLPGPGTDAQTGLAPDGRTFASARGDGRIFVVSVRDGRIRLLTPPGLPARPVSPGSNRRHVGRGGWTAETGSTTIRWAPSGSAFVVSRLLVRENASPSPGGATTRAVVCTLRPARCTSAGPAAPAELIPLGRGRLLRLDGPVTRGGDDENGTHSGFGVAEERSILEQARRLVVTAASVVPPRGRLRVLRAVTGRGRTGVVSFASQPSSGPAGVLVRRTRTRVGPVRSEPSDGPAVSVSTRALRPWLVTPGGRVRTFGRRLGVDPIGSLPDGRWIMPTRDVGPGRTAEAPEPELAVLDARGRVRGLPVGGRPLTPVRLALEAGLPDPFAVGARFDSVLVRGGDLVVTLSDWGSGGIVFAPSDRAVVRVPLDGSAPARTLDHKTGASYAVR